MELQQSPLYKAYVKKLGWIVETIDATNVFIKPFPLVGAMAKLQRMHPLPQINHLLPIFRKYKVRRIVAEASANENQETFSQWVNELRRHVKVIASPYLPTKTVLIDLTRSEDEIFKNFTEAKQRAVRRALKNNVVVKESNNIRDMIKIKNKGAGFLGFITTHGLKELWEVFSPDHATCVLGYHNSQPTTDPLRRSFSEASNPQLIAGIFLLFWEDTAYYWIAGAAKKGKKLFAPTFLVWEAIKIAKKRGMKQLDFVGVWDERFPKENTEWRGFTKFKEGFGGNVLYYPTHRQITTK